MTNCVCLHDAEDNHVGAVCFADMSHVFKTEDAGERWCFGCRKRLPHTWELRGAPPGYGDVLRPGVGVSLLVLRPMPYEVPELTTGTRKGVLMAIEYAWEKYPELRLCQLLSNAASALYPDDLFYVEDADLVKALESFQSKSDG